MRKFWLVLLLLPAMSGFAYSGSYASDEMSGFAVFLCIVMGICIFLSILMLVRWWNMTSDIKEIKEYITRNNPDPKLTYLIAIGEREEANKRALIIIVDMLMPIYLDSNVSNNKAKIMNDLLVSRLKRMERLGIELPYYVKTGEKFIDFLNEKTGNNVQY